MVLIETLPGLRAYVSTPLSLCSPFQDRSGARRRRFPRLGDLDSPQWADSGGRYHVGFKEFSQHRILQAPNYLSVSK